MRVLGGYRVVAQRLDVPDERVRRWIQMGVPAKYHFDMLRLARTSRRAVKVVTIAALQESQAYGRQLRAERDIRRVHPVSPRSGFSG